MVEQHGILVDLDRCVGCHACEIACKQENKVPLGTRWIKMIQIGPRKVDGRLQMEFVPFLLDGCNLCRHRTEIGYEPACVANCPTEALKYCDEAEALDLLKSGRRHQICKVIGS